MFQRILVPLDGSMRAERAIPIAARIARASSGSVVLVRVVSKPSGLWPSVAPQTTLVQQILADDLAEAEGYLSVATRSPELQGVTTETVVRFGPTVSSILAVADSYQSDLIVLCSHGYTGITRRIMGSVAEKLAREAPVEADLVVPVPDSGVTAAVGYAAESGIPFRFGLIRNHYVGRTFIEPSQSVRDFGVKLKLNPVRSLLEGKRIVLIDDSIVRGTTSRKIVRMIRNAGATEVHMRISCPPTISPCYYGVDTPSKKQLIAANKSVDEIRDYIGADSLAYLSLDGLKRACGEGESISYCSACYTGKYPTDIIDVEEIQPATVRR